MRMCTSCRILLLVILEGFSMMKVENRELGMYRGRFSHVRIMVMYHPMSSTVPSTSLFSILLIQSPTLNGRVKKSINPAKKLEIISRPAKPIATPPIPPKARTDCNFRPMVSIITRIAMTTVTTVANRLMESTWVLSTLPSLENRERILSIHLRMNHVAAKMTPSSRATLMYFVAPVADSGRATASAMDVPTVNTDRNSSGRCMHSKTDSL
mmetsp:Transcript_12172/g.37105  ORF Transcript_12172/g.37105 Transcript_12172/m.37105 type:complete len:211 (-) Transcript_12172:670-1302(-)